MFEGNLKSGAKQVMDRLRDELGRFKAMYEEAPPANPCFYPYMFRVSLTGREVIDMVRYVAYLESALAHERSKWPIAPYGIDPEPNPPTPTAASLELLALIEQINKKENTLIDQLARKENDVDTSGGKTEG